MSTASNILEQAREDAESYNRERAEQLFEMYKILLADQWHELDEQERRNFIKRMFFAVYGAYDEPEVFNILSKVEETDIYKYAKAEDML